jgi:hypothetical protein
MKEKINEIAIRAKIQMVSEPRLEEFAELIIAECIDAVRESIKFPTTTYERDVTDPRIIEKCVEAINGRFK